MDFKSPDGEIRAVGQPTAATKLAPGQWPRVREKARMLWLLWKERRHARAAARASLVDFKNFGDSHSDLHPKDLYIAWVEHRLACGRPEAQSIVRQAAASFAEWPNDCELCFRHVVQYTVITAYLANHPTNSGTMANMVVEIARSIPLAL